MVEKGRVLKLIVAALAGGALFSLAGCGGTDGGKAGDETYDGTSYVDTDDSAGGLTLVVNDTDLNVAGMSGFFVRVVDRNGAAVPNIEIACDTESGLALIEPSTGYEMTDSNGQMSGKVGCELPGSYLIGCRLPVGAGQRAGYAARSWLVSHQRTGPPDALGSIPGLRSGACQPCSRPCQPTRVSRGAAPRTDGQPALCNGHCLAADRAGKADAAVFVTD